MINKINSVTYDLNSVTYEHENLLYQIMLLKIFLLEFTPLEKKKKSKLSRNSLLITSATVTTPEPAKLQRCSMTANQREIFGKEQQLK